jgi:hypothetical protein
MRIIFFSLALIYVGCASEPLRCINYSERRAKYIRQYVADEMDVTAFIIVNADLDNLQEIGIPDCEDK